jgi:outer membrane protein TolC
MLSAENTLEAARESFRNQADEFKLFIGMPIEEPLGAADLEDIAAIEQKTQSGTYPLLGVPLAIRNVERAMRIALERRLDLITLHDRVDDARRGVAISRNALLPRLDWQGSVNFYTDPNAYSTMQFEFEHSDWFTQITLEVPWERTRERNDLRARLIDVRAAQRAELDQAERIRVDVRRNVNLLRLADISVDIQERAVKVAERQAEYASLQFEEGLISNRDKLEAEDDLLRARAALSLAKTSRWNQLLQFRLVTETLRVDDDGAQQPDPESIQN